MSRFGGGGSYSHSCRRIEAGFYRISWTIDRYINGSRLRWPRTYSRDTDEKGAIRFCKKHGIPMPEQTGGAS